MTHRHARKNCDKESGRKRTRPLPFKVHRDMAANLSDQVADGLRQAILTGYYRKGEALPNLDEIAARVCVFRRETGMTPALWRKRHNSPYDSLP